MTPKMTLSQTRTKSGVFLGVILLLFWARVFAVFARAEAICRFWPKMTPKMGLGLVWRSTGSPRLWSILDHSRKMTPKMGVKNGPFLTHFLGSFLAEPKMTSKMTPCGPVF